MGAAGETRERQPLLFGEDDVHREDDGGRSVDRIGGAGLLERNLVEQNLHVAQGVDRDADLADLTER